MINQFLFLFHLITILHYSIIVGKQRSMYKYEASNTIFINVHKIFILEIINDNDSSMFKKNGNDDANNARPAYAVRTASCNDHKNA